MEIQVLSKEMIKPSSQNHPPTYTFSYFDQITVSSHSPHIYYYQAPITLGHEGHNIMQTLAQNLKVSLSKTLTLYYPLAGRLALNAYIDCNDEGVHFLEAQAKCKLSQAIQNPNLLEQKTMLLPYEDKDMNDLVLAVQLNFFECGGLAVGLRLSQKIMDGCSRVTFMRNWAAITRGDSSRVLCPRFESALFFPPRELLTAFGPASRTTDRCGGGDHDQKIMTKRLVFTPAKIDGLKAKYSVGDHFKPTRIEAISTFLWLRLISSKGKNRLVGGENGRKKVYVIGQAVNLRKRVPPLGDEHVGNLVVGPWAKVESTNISEESTYEIISQWRGWLKEVNGQFMRSDKQVMDNQSFLKEMQEKTSKGEWERYIFTSICRYPTYEADFGFGKPIWVCSMSPPGAKNLFLLRDNPARFGDGIEVWVNLKAEDMAKFECDEELLEFAEIGLQVMEANI